MEIRNYKQHQKGLVMNFMKERYQLYEDYEQKNRKGEIYGHCYLFKKPMQFYGRTFDITIVVDDTYKDWKGESSIMISCYYYYGSFPWRMWNDQAARILHEETGWSMHYCKIVASRFSTEMCEECNKVNKVLDKLESIAA